METRYYSIHDQIQFKITDSSGFFKRYFDKTRVQFENYLIDYASKLDFRVEIGPFTPKEKDCFILDDTYYISQNYIYFKDNRKLSKWEIEIEGLEDNAVLRISTNLIGNISFPVTIIEFFIQYYFLKKSKVFIHASGLSKGGKGIAFLARSGVGKTTLVISLLEKGFSYLSDNYLILDKQAIKGYISPLNIFSYNRLPIIEKNLTRSQKISMVCKNILYNCTNKYFKVFEKINPSKLFDDFIVDNASLDLICLLGVDNIAGDKKTIGFFQKETLVKRLRYNMELDLTYFNKLIYSYGYVYPDAFISNFWKMYEENLEKNLSFEVPSFYIRAPLRWDIDTVDKIERLVNQQIL